MPARLILFSQEGYWAKPVGEKPKMADDIIEFDIKDHILKGGRLSAFVNSRLVSWLKQVDSGFVDSKDTIYTMAIEHVDTKV